MHSDSIAQIKKTTQPRSKNKIIKNLKIFRIIRMYQREWLCIHNLL